MSEVKCITLDGHIRIVQNDQLIFRPAAYALIVHENKLLVLKLRATGKYHLPGGGIKIGERMQESLRREVQEETGLEIDQVRFAHFEEVFFYYDPSDKAYHGLHFFFICQAKTWGVLADDQVMDGSAEQPRWVEIRNLHPEDFQIHGEIILALCKQAAA